MQGPTNESVGSEFNVDVLKQARDQALLVIERASSRIRPGTSELEAKKIVQEIQAELGAPKSWHPPQIRFGENSVLPFGKVGLENPTLNINDIYFLDIGPIFNGHEGDVGRSFALGNDPEMQRCCRDVEAIWHEVKQHWQNNGATGPELYDFAEKSATKRGWLLQREKANGHRIADFPHAAKIRGSVEEFAGHPAANRWILEIQIRHPEHRFGAFYEDLLH